MVGYPETRSGCSSHFRDVVVGIKCNQVGLVCHAPGVRIGPRSNKGSTDMRCMVADTLGGIVAWSDAVVEFDMGGTGTADLPNCKGPAGARKV